MRLTEHVRRPGDAYLNLSCPVCGCVAVPYFRRGRTHFDRCPECAFVYARFVPSGDTLATLRPAHTGPATAADTADTGDDTGDGDARRASARLSSAIGDWWHARGIIRCAQGRRRLLVIGDSGGRLPGTLERTGHFDIERAGATRAQPLPDRPAQPDDALFDRRYADRQFDLIAGFHVLDGVQHLGEFIDEIRRILAPRGRVYFVAPRGATAATAHGARSDARRFEAPGRFWYFSVPAIRQLMTDRGFRVHSARGLPGRPHLTVIAEKTD